MSKVEGTDAELRERFQAELPQIREWLDEFTGDEVQVAPGIRMFDPADRARSSGWTRRPGAIRKPVLLWTNVDGGSLDAHSESAFDLQRQERTIVKAPASSEDWSYQSGLEFQLTQWYGPSQAAVSQVQFCFGRFYQ